MRAKEILLIFCPKKKSVPINPDTNTSSHGEAEIKSVSHRALSAHSPKPKNLEVSSTDALFWMKKYPAPSPPGGEATSVASIHPSPPLVGSAEIVERYNNGLLVETDGTSKEYESTVVEVQLSPELIESQVETAPPVANNVVGTSNREQMIIHRGAQLLDVTAPKCRPPSSPPNGNYAGQGQYHDNGVRITHRHDHQSSSTVVIDLDSIPSPNRVKGLREKFERKESWRRIRTNGSVKSHIQKYETAHTVTKGAVRKDQGSTGQLNSDLSLRSPNHGEKAKGANGIVIQMSDRGMSKVESETPLQLSNPIRGKIDKKRESTPVQSSFTPYNSKMMEDTGSTGYSKAPLNSRVEESIAASREPSLKVMVKTAETPSCLKITENSNEVACISKNTREMKVPVENGLSHPRSESIVTPATSTAANANDCGDSRIIPTTTLRKIEMPSEKCGIELGRVVEDTGSSAIRNASSRPVNAPPPPPPPLLLPLISTSSAHDKQRYMPETAQTSAQATSGTITFDARDSLMEAIRNAGGVRSLKKPITTKKDEALTC